MIVVKDFYGVTFRGRDLKSRTRRTESAPQTGNCNLRIETNLAYPKQGSKADLGIARVGHPSSLDSALEVLLIKPVLKYFGYLNTTIG